MCRLNTESMKTPTSFCGEGKHIRDTIKNTIYHHDGREPINNSTLKQPFITCVMVPRYATIKQKHVNSGAADTPSEAAVCFTVEVCHVEVNLWVRR